MTQKGRKSAQALQLVKSAEVIELKRPDPPSDLTKEQAREWRAMANSLPADWFGRETHGLLAQYCRHVCDARVIADQIAALVASDEYDFGTHEALLKAQERETRAIMAVSRSMRTTQQATYHPERSKGVKSASPSPWDA